jgi:hypothetical protein
MKKLVLALMVLGGVAAPSAGVTSLAQAQGYDRYDDSDGNRYRRYKYPHYAKCQATIRAVGVAYPVEALSRASATKFWRREAQSVYGREYSWQNARDKRFDCEPYKLTIRCTASARPCAF